MSGNSGLLEKPTPVAPGGQGYIQLAYNPQSIVISNTSTTTNGSFVAWWLYPDATAPVSSSGTINSEGAQSIYPPPADGSGVTAAAVVVFNNGMAPLSCQIHR